MANRMHKDLAKLYKAPPPDCILDTGDDDSDGLSSLAALTFYLLGPESTAFHGGAWKVRLVIPNDYPRSAPKAFFVTKIFHPNVQPSTGEICVDTLKRDWSQDVDLIHIILTIRCLLIQPNPESSLNEEAGKLLLDDYTGFERKARVMTKVHSISRSEILRRFELTEADLNHEDDTPKARIMLESNQRQNQTPNQNQNQNTNTAQKQLLVDDKENNNEASSTPLTHGNGTGAGILHSREGPDTQDNVNTVMISNALEDGALCSPSDMALALPKPGSTGKENSTLTMKNRSASGGSISKGEGIVTKKKKKTKTVIAKVKVGLRRL